MMFTGGGYDGHRGVALSGLHIPSGPSETSPTSTTSTTSHVGASSTSQ
jgi:hypothetical protein